jgi:hypothetical protein
MMMLVDKTLTLGTFLHHQAPPTREQLAKEAETRQFSIVEGKDEADGRTC